MKKTVFVTGGSGFIGAEVCRASVAAGDEVIVLCRSKESARKVKALGAAPIEGDLLCTGAWQDLARAVEYVIHLAQPAVFGARVTTRRAERYRVESLLMDKNLFLALASHRIKRVVYVSGTCYYGDLGVTLCDETSTPKPHGIGRFIIDNVDLVGRCVKEGLPIVTAFPGAVYGPPVISAQGSSASAVACGIRMCFLPFEGSHPPSPSTQTGRDRGARRRRNRYQSPPGVLTGIAAS